MDIQNNSNALRLVDRSFYSCILMYLGCTENIEINKILNFLETCNQQIMVSIVSIPCLQGHRKDLDTLASMAENCYHSFQAKELILHVKFEGISDNVCDMSNRHHIMPSFYFQTLTVCMLIMKCVK